MLKVLMFHFLIKEMQITYSDSKNAMSLGNGRVLLTCV